MNKSSNVIKVDFQKEKSRKVKSNLPLKILGITAALTITIYGGAKVVGIYKEKEANWDAYITCYNYYTKYAGNASEEGFKRFLENNKLAIDSYRQEIKETGEEITDEGLENYLENYYNKGKGRN